MGAKRATSTLCSCSKRHHPVLFDQLFSFSNLNIISSNYNSRIHGTSMCSPAINTMTITRHKRFTETNFPFYFPAIAPCLTNFKGGHKRYLVKIMVRAGIRLPNQMNVYQENTVCSNQSNGAKLSQSRSFCTTQSK